MNGDEWAQNLLKSCKDQEIATNVIRAIENLFENDEHLLRVDVAERAITHRLATYLEQYFEDWDVDCEYNRDGFEIKHIPDGSGDDGEHGSKVFPDVIVHQRGSNHNLLVIEVKKDTNKEPDSKDLGKLHGFKYDLDYHFAAFVRLRVGEGPLGVVRAEFV